MNTTDNPDDPFFRCWARNQCGWCLDEKGCSWCPFTQSCVPNPYTLQFLAPAWDEQICPDSKNERWEIRTRSLGCWASTVTILSVMGTVLTTLAAVLLVWLGVLGVRWVRRYHAKQEAGWWKVWKRMPGRDRIRWRILQWESRESDAWDQEPLLGT
ncbi:hypothetical protein QBC34DRAFT_94541 [Podospora aff. communis PSN243]|uniref:PSI domain-containing protein n=1 Tax=Podospora aff. communis PSN243 TaxID=3040156 RepID=A0AAV9GMP1_9PEZI|nr:hypothetical protein QBC34DRAFT_94541 [Podospora aff. communis PSN243]